MKETIITRKVTINAPMSKVWGNLSDFGNIANMSPSINKSYLTSDQQNGIGATRHCELTTMGAQLEEKVIDWVEGKSMKISIYETKNMPMLTGLEAEFSLTPDNGNTLLTGTFQYKTENYFGQLMNKFAMKKMNEKAWVGFMSGIKHHVETGEIVEKNSPIETESVGE